MRWLITVEDRENCCCSLENMNRYTRYLAISLTAGALACTCFAPAVAQDSEIVTSDTISPTELTIPSLWWVQQQFAATETFGGKLIEQWQAKEREPESVGLVTYLVNAQLWSLIDYLDRYAFIHEFGTAAKNFGYNIRVVDYRNRVLGEYVCNFKEVDLTALLPNVNSTKALEASQQVAQQVPCNVVLDSGGKAGLRGRSTNPFGE